MHSQVHSQMHSQMHWDGYSLPASQLPYAIPAQQLVPYSYNDSAPSDFQVRPIYHMSTTSGRHVCHSRCFMAAD